MFSIIAFLSEIPYYFTALVERITGADVSIVTDLFSGGFATVIELAEKVLGQL